MNKSREFRQGAVGALLDEYQRAMEEWIEVLEQVPDKQCTAVLDSDTADPDCTSIETVMNHCSHYKAP